MAQRRKRISLGGGTVQHHTQKLRSERQANSFANMATDFANAGDCTRAIRMLTAAWDERGRAQAHAVYADQAPKSKKGAWSRRQTEGTPSMYKTTDAAEKTVIAKCVRK